MKKEQIDKERYIEGLYDKNIVINDHEHLRKHTKKAKGKL